MGDSIDISKGWQPDAVPFGVEEGYLTDAKNLIRLDKYYAVLRGLEAFSATSIDAVTFTGTGLNDATSGGTYTTTNAETDYVVKIDGAATPDTFTWSNDGGSTWEATGVAITGAAQTLDQGVTITFAATTGHTLNDQWAFTARGSGIVAPIRSTGTGTNYALGAIECRDTMGNWYAFIGTSNKLYKLDATGKLTDVSKAAGYASASNRWSFVQYGNDLVATNYADTMQYMTNISTATAFADHTVSPPKAKYILLYFGHLVAGFLYEGATIFPKRLRWTALEDVTDWTASATTLADFQDFPDNAGDITGLAQVGSTLVVFFQNSITTGTYGSSYIIEFVHNAVRGVGCYFPGSLINVEGTAYFWGQNDIYRMSSEGVESIGTNVRNTVLTNINLSKLHLISTVYDQEDGVIYWFYPSSSSVVNDSVLIYNTKASVFTRGTVECHTAFPMHGGALLMDSIDSIYPDIDDMPEYMDSSFYQANSSFMTVIAEDGTVKSLTGPALSGLLITGEVKSADDVIMVRRVRVKAQGYVDAPAVRVGSRMEENDGVAYSTSTSVGSNGYADVRSSGRFHRVEVTTGEHSGLYDIEVDAVKRGVR